MAKGTAAKGGAAARGKGKGRPARAPVDPIAQQANLQIQAAEQPIYQQIQAERAANLARAQAQMGFSKAAASIMQAAAPAVSNLYSGAANADAGYARGLGNVAQGAVDQSVQGNNAFLSKMGTPQAGLETAAPVGDIAYGLHGYIPATTLQREGAAFGSAAQLAPANVLNQGQQTAGATLANDPNLLSLQNEVAKIASTEPAVYQSLLKNAQDVAYKQAELGQGQQRIAISQQSLQIRQAYEQASLQMRQAGLRLQNQKFGFSVQQAIAKGQMPDSALSGKYGYIVDSYGQPILGPKGQKIPVVKSSKGGLPGINGKQGAAAAIAAQLGISVNEYFTKLHDAGKDANYYWGQGANWKIALGSLVALGVPKPIAFKALRDQGYMPGVRGAPPISLGEGGGNPTGAGVGMAAGLGKSIGKAVAGIANPVHRAAAKVILQYANEYLGVPYLWGGTTPKGFDCSGFAQYLYAKAGISIPRTTYTQWGTGLPVGKNQLEPGDLVFFKGSDSVGGLPGHVGVYIGGGKMIDAPHTGASVRVESVFGFPGYMGARRYG